MTREEAVQLALELCDEADMIRLENYEHLRITYVFAREWRNFFVSVVINDKFNKIKFKSDLESLLLHSHYGVN